MHPPFRKLRVLACLIVGLASPATAHAAFETWHFPGPALPFRLNDVAFSREDRRDAVVEAVRDMARRQLLASGLFHAGAASGVTVELRGIDSSAVVDADGTGIGRAAILYRVGDSQGRVLFNDRIESEARVTVRESLPMQQSTLRAARYRAFTNNLDLFARRFWRTVAVRADDAIAPRIGQVVLDRDLETPERTADFAARLLADLDILAPIPVKGGDAPSLTLRVTAASFRETSPPGAETVAAETKLTLAAETASGARIWSGEATGKAAIDRKQALLSGLSPVDAALAAAGQSGLKRIAPDLAMALEEYGRLETMAERRLPFRLDGIDALPNAGDGAAIARLRLWNATGQPLAVVWADDGTPLRIRIDSLSTHLRKTGNKEGIAEISATYSVFDGDGRPLLTSRQNASARFSAAGSGGIEPGARASRVALGDSWNGLLGQIQSLAVPLTPKDDSAPSR